MFYDGGNMLYPYLPMCAFARLLLPHANAARAGGRACAPWNRHDRRRAAVFVSRRMNSMTSSTPQSALRLRLIGWALALAAAVFAAAAPSQALAQNTGALERRVKAAFLYKFLGYAEFPVDAFADPASAITIGVIGSDEMAAELTRGGSGRSGAGRPIAVRQLHDGDAPAVVHLLFVAGADNARAARALRAVPGALLTVTECEDGLRYGSVINFRIVDARVRFDVSLEAAEKKNVKLSSRLLTVAYLVQKESP